MVSTCRYCVASTGIPPVSRRRVRRLSQGRGSGDPRRRRFVPLGASEATFTLSYSYRYSVPRNANMRTYFCLNFSWTRRCVVLCLVLRSQLYSGPRFYKAGGSQMDRIILLLLLLTFLVILSK